MFKQNKTQLSVVLLTLCFPLAGCVSDDVFSDNASRPYGGSKQHPIKIENGSAVVENCGQWPKNLADSSSNEMNINHGCAVQSNIAAMTAYPSDLTGKKRKLPPPLGDIQYTAIKKITTSPTGSSAAAAPAASP